MKASFARHIVATVCSTSFLSLVPLALYVTLIVWSNDLGGPLNLILIPMVSAAIGLVISLVAFVPLSLLAENSKLTVWLLIVGGLSLGLTVAAISGWFFVRSVSHQGRVFLLVGSATAYVVGGFFVYLCSLAASSRIWPTSKRRSR